MRKLIRPVVLIVAVAVACLAVPSGPLLAQSNYQQQQQWQRQQEMQRQQDMQRQQQDQQRQQMQAQQRQQMQEQQRQQMQAQQRQQMQEQQRQQMQAQQRQQMQQQQQTQQRQQMQTQQQNQQRQTQQQQTAEQQRRQMQQQGKLGTIQGGKPTGMVISGGMPRMARPLTAGEIQRGFTGRVTTDGRALIKFQGRVFAVPASRISGLSAKLAAEKERRATTWAPQKQSAISASIKKLELGSSGRSAAVTARVDSARRAKLENQNAAASGGHGNGPGDGGNGGKNMPPSVEMSGAAANMPHDFKRQAEGKPTSDPTAQRLPYEKGARASEIVLNEERVFVRVHGDKNQARDWIMRHEDIAGLTPQQIKDKFALPELPKYVSDVYVPAGTRLRVGTVNPQDDWGTGGGTQYELKDRLPASAFRNQRPLE